MTDLDELKALWSDAPQVLALIERLEKAEGASSLALEGIESAIESIEDGCDLTALMFLRTASRALGGDNHE